MKSPILNSPYAEPSRHFKADERGLTEEIFEYRRPSSFYIPVPRAKTKQQRLELNTADGAFGIELQRENELINKVREKIRNWRDNDYKGITKTSRDLLSYWKDETRENKLFF
ncbi:MAG TPA: restriction endonuclease, partial [Candidatus Avalokitesvara rifleensis]